MSGKAQTEPRRRQETASLFNPGFVVLTILFFFVSSATAAFFYLQPYLQTLGISPAWIGLIIGSDSLASFVIQPTAAPYLHEGNGRRWMVVGLVIMALALLAYLPAKSTGLLLAVRIVQGVGFVCFLSAMMAVVVSFIPDSRSGQGFGFLSLVRLGPYALVPPVVTYLMRHSLSFPQILVGFAVILAVSLVTLAFLSPAGGGNRPARLPAAKPVGIAAALKGLKNGTFLALLAVNLLVYVCYAATFFYISGFGRAAGLARADLFFTIATVMMVAIRLAGGGIFDKFDKFRLAGWCLVVLAASFLALPYVGETAFYCVAGVFGLAWGVLLPLLNAMVFDVSSPDLRGVNLNLTLTAMQGGFFLGPLVGGLVLAATGYRVLFFLCALVTAGALATTMAGKPKDKEPI